MSGSLGSSPLIEWGVASRTLPGQRQSGDSYLVKSSPAGTLVAVVDGLGHGDEAASAARTAVAVLEAGPHESVTDAVRCCHQKLARTRGAAMSIALFGSQDRMMTWLAVGNVQGMLIPGGSAGSRRREFLFLRGGVVGFRLPLLRASKIPVAPRDTLILATDGIGAGFGQDLPLDDPPRRIADVILTRYGRDTDDALVLVARCLGWVR